ncbi:hypothetical protein EAO73_35090 [Streptomyces sp. col6]|uniref:DUF6233 domain-containing protein n=1 Tax=Streptomyces sp. col6 TaxID=2478958 RepID=UPI0011CD82F2|nr:DUF6233 domain-containing protein [Streptomyces sp. col6]TXR94508.1 hypothetical protein EAO73_35090 [Streptomyces sp. col6]
MAGSGSISPLDKWRATREYLAWQLRCADQRVRELEAEEEQERRKAARERERVSFKIQPQRSHEGALLHRGDCALYKSSFGFISAEDAAVAIDEPDIEACPVCLPDDGLPPV